MPKIIDSLSIVCATHNNIEKLNMTLESIVNNSYHPNEVVICSTNILDKKKIKNTISSNLNILFIFSERKSQTYQRKMAIKKSIGSIIMQIDDDVLLDKNSIYKLYSHFNKNTKGKIVVGAYLLYPNKKHVSYRFNNYYKNSVIKYLYKFLNNGNRVNDMSVLSSGRLVPKLNIDNKSKNFQWLSSLLMYTKTSYYEAFKIDIDGKGFFEDVFFTHSLYRKGYKLIIEEKSVAYIDFNLPTGLSLYLKAWSMQLRFVKIFNKSYLLFAFDTFIFFFFHTFISLMNILRKND